MIIPPDIETKSTKILSIVKPNCIDIGPQNDFVLEARCMASPKRMHQLTAIAITAPAMNPSKPPG
jgi:hypothetical protein